MKERMYVDKSGIVESNKVPDDQVTSRLKRGEWVDANAAIRVINATASTTNGNGNGFSWGTDSMMDASARSERDGELRARPLDDIETNVIGHLASGHKDYIIRDTLGINYEGLLEIKRSFSEEGKRLVNERPEYNHLNVLIGTLVGNGTIKIDLPKSDVSLSPNEFKLARLISQGFFSKAIAMRINIKVQEVNRRRTALMTKVGAVNMSHLTAICATLTKPKN